MRDYFLLVLALVAKNPKDKTMLSLAEKVKQRLKTAREKEKPTSDVTNPLGPSVDLMALNENELEEWLVVFRRFDKDKVGGLTIQQIFETVEETPTAFAKSIFNGVDAVDPDTGLIECGDFMRAVCIYCFFGKQEILRFELPF